MGQGGALLFLGGKVYEGMFIMRKSFLNYSNFSNSCRFGKFSRFINFFKMVVYGSYINPIQFRHTLLRHPERVAVENNLDARFPLGRLVQQNA